MLNGYIKKYPAFIRVFDEILPLDLLKQLDKEGIQISDIKTHEIDVEDYYLSLIRGGQDNE